LRTPPSACPRLELLHQPSRQAEPFELRVNGHLPGRRRSSLLREVDPTLGDRESLRCLNCAVLDLTGLDSTQLLNTFSRCARLPDHEICSISFTVSGVTSRSLSRSGSTSATRRGQRWPRNQSTLAESARQPVIGDGLTAFGRRRCGALGRLCTGPVWTPQTMLRAYRERAWEPSLALEAAHRSLVLRLAKLFVQALGIERGPRLIRTRGSVILVELHERMDG
jgi:hypothetical protein